MVSVVLMERCRIIMYNMGGGVRGVTIVGLVCACIGHWSFGGLASLWHSLLRPEQNMHFIQFSMAYIGL